MKTGKQARLFGLKAVGDGNPVSDVQLAKINTFALVPLTAEQIYVRKYVVAHNGIDRDTERFSNELLDQFAISLTGKGFFVEGHPGYGLGGPGKGRFFNSFTEEMTAEAFKTLTGEEIRLPDDIPMAKVLWGEAYLLKLASNADTLANIDGGIYAFISIGFKAPWRSVTDNQGNHIYGEYGPNGEAREASLVWLGAQPGAGAKCAGCSGEGCGKEECKKKEKTPNKQEDADMELKDFLKSLKEKVGKAVTIDVDAPESVIKVLTDHVADLGAKVLTLTPLAEDGKAYRKQLVDDVVRFGVMLAEIPTDEAGQKAKRDFIESWPIQHIKDLQEKYDKEARIKFPDKFQTGSKDPEAEKLRKEKEAADHRKKGGKIDYTDPAHNDLMS